MQGGVNMLAYSILMFLIGTLFLYLAISVQNGKTSLIKDYHQAKVKEEEKTAYGKGFSKGLFGIAVSLFLSGIIPFFVDIKQSVILSLVVLLGGMIISFIIIVRVQKKYNGGMF